MEINRVVISQPNTSLRYAFFNKVNVVPSNELSDAILSFTPEGGNADFVIETENNLSFVDVTHIKVNLADTGSIIAVFKKESLSLEKRETMFNELAKLRDDKTPTKESQEIKIKKVVQIVGDYSPIFVSYYNNGQFVFTKSSLEGILNDIQISFPVLILLPSLDFAAPKQKTNKIFKFKKKEDTSKEEAPKEISPKVEKVPKEKVKFVMPTLFTFDYLFFAIFTAFISFGTYTSVFQIINQEAIAAFVIVLVIAFVVTLNFATYKTKKESDDFEYKLSKIWVPVAYVVLGSIIGSVIGLVIAQFVMKAKEEINVNYGLIFGVVLPSTLLVNVLSIFSPILTSKILAKIMKNSANRK